MVIWRKFLYIFLILTALTGSCLAKANLLTDSPWASFQYEKQTRRQGVDFAERRRRVCSTTKP